MSFIGRISHQDRRIQLPRRRDLQLWGNCSPSRYAHVEVTTGRWYSSNGVFSITFELKKQKREHCEKINNKKDIQDIKKLEHKYYLHHSLYAICHLGQNVAFAQKITQGKKHRTLKLSFKHIILMMTMIDGFVKKQKFSKF